MAKHRPKVLSQSDEAFFEKAGGLKWMRRKVFREGPQKRYKRALDAFAEQLAGLGLDPNNPQALTELLAVVLDKDGTMGAWFRDHNFPVDKPAEFARLCHAAAGALVSDYLHEAELPDPAAAVLLNANLTDNIGKLLHLAAEQGELSGQEGRKAGEAWWGMDARADNVEAARAELEELLASDVNVAHKADPDVPETERQREIAKAALMQLKITQLKKLAQEEELPELGNREALAELVVRKYDANTEAIAELVLKHSTPDVERGWATRLMPLREPVDLQKARTNLADLEGTYMRLEVATWLVFNKVDETSTGAAFEGDIRFYAVHPQREGDKPQIASLQRQHPVSVRLRQGAEWALIDGRSSTDVKRLRKALAHALGIKGESAFDPAVPALTGDLALFNAVTVRMLYMLDHGIRDEHLDYQTFRQAEFSRLDNPVKGPEQVAVQAVRLQGQHVMDDPAACRYILGGQTLGSVDIRVKWRPNLRQDAFFTNVRLGIARDHAYVLTAFADDATQAHALHRELVQRMQRALTAKVDPAKLTPVANQIAKRASEAAPPEEVDIWGPHAEEATAGASAATALGDEPAIGDDE
jgi:hypothetical protein